MTFYNSFNLKCGGFVATIRFDGIDSAYVWTVWDFIWATNFQDTFS